MARRPTQYGSAHVKQRDAVRPLLFLLLIGAGGLSLFLWLQKDTVGPVVAVADDAPPAEPAASAVRPDLPPPTSAADELKEWWFDAEGRLLEAFDGLQAAKEGSCDDLEYGLTNLGALSPPRGQPILAPFSAIVSSLDRALAGCRTGNAAIVEGGGRSARQQLGSLLKALRVYGLQPSSLLADI